MITATPGCPTSQSFFTAVYSQQIPPFIIGVFSWAKCYSFPAALHTVQFYGGGTQNTSRTPLQMYVSTFFSHKKSSPYYRKHKDTCSMNLTQFPYVRELEFRTTTSACLIGFGIYQYADLSFKFHGFFVPGDVDIRRFFSNYDIAVDEAALGLGLVEVSDDTIIKKIVTDLLKTSRFDPECALQIQTFSGALLRSILVS